MISHLTISNFQSLHHVDIELRPLTVIVGPSSSGKSAFTRALKTLTGNARGHSFITHGERICTIKAVTDKGTVTLKRGKATDDNEYTTVPSDPNVQQKTYTKLGGAVPVEVTEFLGIAAKDPINYAGQHDKPYLLDDGGGEVARVLGSLTNVNIIFEAARESNRRKLNRASTLKTRASDIDIIMAKAATYKPLKAQMAAMEEAEKNLAAVAVLNRKVAVLTNAVEVLEMADEHLARLDIILATPVPDATEIHAAADRLKAYRSTLSIISEQAAAFKAAAAIVTASEAAHTTLQEQYTDKLIAAGTCPTCSQSTETLEHHHATA